MTLPADPASGDRGGCRNISKTIEQPSRAVLVCAAISRFVTGWEVAVSQTRRRAGGPVLRGDTDLSLVPDAADVNLGQVQVGHRVDRVRLPAG